MRKTITLLQPHLQPHMEHFIDKVAKLRWEFIVLILATALSIKGIQFAYVNEFILAYGDAESHLNIAKRVIHSLTPGIAQLGGIWLPLPHLLMVPFVFFDFLWKTGLAGAIVSGIAFIVSSLFLYKLAFLITKNVFASFFAFLIFALNPNALYMQATPMTEIPLICFFILSTYFFCCFLKDDNNYLSLIGAAFFGFCATLSRYDGWFLVLFEAIIIILYYLPSTKLRTIMEGKTLLFSTLAFFGIVLWMIWDFLILGDPFYFKNSQFSANSQQQAWLLRGELPAYKDLSLAFLYYLVTANNITGIILFALSVFGLLFYLFKENGSSKVFSAFILSVPFIFNVFTLYMGQSVIFIPDLTPITFEWQLFNVRYGMLMLPFVSFFVAYLFAKSHRLLKMSLIILFMLQLSLYVTGHAKILTLEDGVHGLSSSKIPDAEKWLAKHYDGGFILFDDYARTVSIVRSNLPMQNIIYVGNKPYWEESLKEPEKYATWIIMQKEDSVWNNIYVNVNTQARLYKYFNKVYTSPEILIFKRIKPTKQGNDMYLQKNSLSSSLL